MIHVQYVKEITKELAATMDIIPMPAGLKITLTEESITELKELLHRALNCAAPDKYPDWVALADKLETLK